MSALPKKKLCWNCEGNVPKDLDNCPYCAVYLQGIGDDANAGWIPDEISNEIPPPPYQIQEEIKKEEQEANNYPLQINFNQLKQDVLPALFLMGGSVFFLFGIILTLFSENGVFTLQWQSHYAPYFLFISLPLIFFGWKFVQQLEE
ncbi:MAG: hypothetical protein LW832_08460 [Parachlamydia sp.]|jgi:hypothetical protein|nr:hypothetical protein [Parachlamydia sp.]